MSFVWFSILGGSEYNLQLNQGVDMSASLDDGIENVLFDTLREFPLSGMTVGLAIFLIAIFFVTGADTASIVMGMLSQHGQEEPHRWLVVFWGVAMGAVAAVLLWAGGLEGLQMLVIMVAESVHGWLFVLTSAFFVVFSAYMAISRYGNIKLGPDDAEPEFTTFSWVSMMFATGMGIGLMFYGVAEPLTYSTSRRWAWRNPEPRRQRACRWNTPSSLGPAPWAMYAVIGLAIGYFAYRKGYGNLVSGAFRPLLGDRVLRGPGKAIDVVAIFATLFGSATSLGLGALQITGGIDNVFGSGGGSKLLAVAVIGFLTLCFVISAVSGIEKGVKYLSNANAVAAGLLVLFIFVVGPTVFILGTFTESLGGYLTHLPTMSFRTGVFGGSLWLHTWTIFYWAWWISWTPSWVCSSPASPRAAPFASTSSCDPGPEPGVLRMVLDPGRIRIQPSAQPGRRHASVAGRGHRERAVRHAA